MANMDRHRNFKTDQELNVKPITRAPIAPDGGWGWIVVIATFFFGALVAGTYSSFGILFIHFREHFGETTATTSWAGSVLGGTSFSSGMLASALATRYSYRRIAIGGSLLAASSLFASSFSPNIETLIFFYGFMNGVGQGFMFLSSLVMVGYYFKERRALATSIALCGSGIGGLFFAPFIEILIDMYDWRGALWIMAGLVIHGVVFGALLRPLGPNDEKVLLLEASPTTNSAPNDSVSTVIRTSPENREVPSNVEQHNLDIQRKDRGASLLWSEFNDAPSPRNRCMTYDPSTLRKSIGTKNDIFYSGSVYHISQYTSHNNVNEYAVADDGNTKMTRCFQWLYILKLARGCLANMLDWSLLTNITFVIYLASCLFSTMAIYVPLSFLPTMAIEIGSDSQRAAFLVSVFSITDSMGRIIVGIMGDRPWVDILLVTNIGVILAGMATVALPLYETYGFMVTYCAFYGILISPFFALRVVIAVELVGLYKLTSALGFITMAQGVALFIGIPMAGALRDATLTFDASLYVSGLVMILSGTMCLPLRRVKKWETTRMERISENAKKNDETIELL